MGLYGNLAHMTAMKRQKYRKGKQTKRKYLQTLCDLKVER